MPSTAFAELSSDVTPARPDRTPAEEISLILQQLAEREISDEDATKRLNALWEEVHDEPLLRRIIRLILPSLSRNDQGR